MRFDFSFRFLNNPSLLTITLDRCWLGTKFHDLLRLNSLELGKFGAKRFYQVEEGCSHKVRKVVLVNTSNIFLANQWTGTSLVALIRMRWCSPRGQWLKHFFHYFLETFLDKFFLTQNVSHNFLYSLFTALLLSREETKPHWFQHLPNIVLLYVQLISNVEVVSYDEHQLRQRNY